MKRIFVLSLFSIFFTIQSASAQFERGYADLVDELLPSVVSIATSQTVERQTRQLPELPEGHPFNDMFDDFFGNQMPKRENLTGLGSGFIISDEGYVVTNNHVISGADQITVIFNNGIDEVPAEQQRLGLQQEMAGLLREQLSGPEQQGRRLHPRVPPNTWVPNPATCAVFKGIERASPNIHVARREGVTGA